METNIPQSEVDGLLEKIKTSMRRDNFSTDIVDGTRIVVIHPADWEISLLVPYKNTKASEVRKLIEHILYRECNVEDRCCDYFGKQKPKEAYEWFFRHPNTPDDIYERLEQEIEEELGDEIGMGLPKPSGFKSKSDVVFMTLREEYFTEIKNGKDTEYRNLNQYYCDKFFSPGVEKRFVKFNNGYKTGPENQMTFEIAGFVLVSERGDEISPFDESGKLIVSYADIPDNFAPAAYGIKLGKRIA